MENKFELGTKIFLLSLPFLILNLFTVHIFAARPDFGWAGTRSMTAVGGGAWFFMCLASWALAITSCAMLLDNLKNWGESLRLYEVLFSLSPLAIMSYQWVMYSNDDVLITKQACLAYLAALLASYVISKLREPRSRTASA
jgi:hypothetical protein